MDKNKKLKYTVIFMDDFEEPKLYIQNNVLREKIQRKFSESTIYTKSLSSASISIVDDYETWLKGVKSNSFPILTKRFKGRRMALAEIIIKSLYFPSLVGFEISDWRNFISLLNRGKKPSLLHLKEFRTSSLNSSIIEIIKSNEFLKFKKENQNIIRAMFVRIDSGRSDSLGKILYVFDRFYMVAIDNPKVMLLSTSVVIRREKPSVKVLYYF